MLRFGEAVDTTRWRAPKVRCSIAILLLGTAAWAQTFEVASLKPSGPQSGNRIEGGPGTSDPLRYTYTSATLEDLIVIAWNVEYFQVSSKAAIDRDCFDLVAKIPPGTRMEDFRVMLQNLVKERFRLKLHAETREFSGYALVVAKSGFKLKERSSGPTASSASSAAGKFPDLPSNKPGIIAHHLSREGNILIRVRVQQMPMSEIARSLKVPDDVPVVDQTGLAGKYNFTLEYAYPARKSQAVPEEPPAPSVFTAVQQQLGLQLVSKRVPFETVVIDSFNRVPSEN